MNRQATFIGVDPVAEPDEPTAHTKASKYVTAAQLRRSIVDCHRVEDAIWRKLRADGCTPKSSAAKVANCLRHACADAPDWCEQAAWDRIKKSFLDWAHTFGDLQKFVDLRNRKEQSAPVDHEGEHAAGIGPGRSQ